MTIKIKNVQLKIVFSVTKQSNNEKYLNIGWAQCVPDKNNKETAHIKNTIRLLQIVRHDNGIRVGFSKRNLLLQQIS